MIEQQKRIMFAPQSIFPQNVLKRICATEYVNLIEWPMKMVSAILLLFCHRIHSAYISYSKRLKTQNIFRKLDTSSKIMLIVFSALYIEQKGLNRS